MQPPKVALFNQLKPAILVAAVLLLLSLQTQAFHRFVNKQHVAIRKVAPPEKATIEQSVSGSKAVPALHDNNHFFARGTVVALPLLLFPLPEEMCGAHLPPLLLPRNAGCIQPKGP